MEKNAIRCQGTLMDIERKDGALMKAWKAIMTREALEDQNTVKGKTARERWQLIKLVSRIGVQLKQKNIEDGTWQTEEEAHVVSE